MDANGFKYYAFISYSHRDMKIARKLQKRLEHYHLPSALVKSHPNLPKKLSPIFRDESDLIGRGTLKETLQENLDRSNYLILICSPSSAKSDYVNDEVKHFIEIGRADHIIPLIVGGVPHSGGDTECFPPAILALERERELLGIDLQTFGMNEAFVRVIATLLRLDLDAFVSRYRKENKRRAIMLVSALVALIITAVILMPPPYDEVYAGNVLEHAVASYVSAGDQYERLSALTESAINSPEDFSRQLQLYENRIQMDGMSYENSLQTLSDMMKTGKVMPWSRLIMSQEECAELLTLAEKRKDEYKTFADVLVFVMTDNDAHRHYSRYPEILRNLLEIDADIAARLYQIVCSPHLTVAYGNDSAKGKSLGKVFSSVPKQNKHINGENPKQSGESLASLKGDRLDCLQYLYSLGVLEAYDVNRKQQESQPPTKQSQPSTKEEAQSHALNDLLAYVKNCEAMYSDILWAAEAIDTFDRVRSWETLQLARATVSIARADISGLRFPELEMTKDDQENLMRHGIDVGFLENADKMFAAEQQGLKTTCVVLSQSVMNEVFLRDDWELYMRSVANHIELARCDIEYLADVVEWTLTAINDSAATESFTRLLAENCPVTYSRLRKVPDTLANIEASIQSTLDEIERLVLEEAKALGAGRYRLNVMTDAVDQNDAEKLAKNLMAISGVPAMIPKPDWFNGRDMLYFWDDVKPQPRKSLPRVPDSCAARVNGVSLTQFRDYQEELRANGLTCTQSNEDGGKLTLYYAIGESNFALIWEDGGVTIHMTKNPVCFVPRLYLKLYQSARP